MRVFITCIVVLIAQLNSASAQLTSIETAKGPLVFVDTFKTDMNHLVLNPQKIESIDVLKDSAAMAKYGEVGRFGVVVIHPKREAKFSRVDKIIDNYNLPDKDRNLRVCINKNLVQDPQLILIENSEIERVEITTDRHWTNVEDANSGEKFINITTKTKRKNDL